MQLLLIMPLLMARGSIVVTASAVGLPNVSVAFVIDDDEQPTRPQLSWASATPTVTEGELEI